MRTTKTITFFISSTFRDMHYERDRIKKCVFPALNEEYNKKNICLQLIDLRMGIYSSKNDDESAAVAKILKVCCEEINRSKPYLIGVLGDRYGTIPNDEAFRCFFSSQPDNIKGVFGEHNDKSITELELLFRLLGEETLRDGCLFYFRDEKSYEGLLGDKVEIYREADSVRKEKQKKLKDKIREITKSGGFDCCFDYTLKWNKENFVDPELAWEEHLKNKIREIVDREVRSSENANSVFCEERQLIDAFKINHSQNVVCRKEDDEAFCKVARRRGIYIYKGPSGVGKSTFMCRLYDRLLVDEDNIVLFHTAGVFPYSDDIYRVLRRWNEELSLCLGETPIDTYSRDGNEYRTTVEARFKELVNKCCLRNRRVVILIDALDRMSANTLLSSLSFIDERKVCAVMTTTDTNFLLLSELRDVAITDVSSFSEENAREFVKGGLPLDVVDEILDKRNGDGEPAYSSPLWLGLALFTLNSLDIDDFNRISGNTSETNGELKLINYLRGMADKFPAEAGPLFLYLKDRLSDDFAPGFLHRLFAYLSASLMGLRESDLAHLMGDDWDSLSFATIRRYMSFAFVEVGIDCRWNLSHNIFIETMRNNDVKEQDKCHDDIANHLLAKDDCDSLKMTSCFYHLMKAGRYDEACSLVLRLPYIESKISNGYFDELLREMEQLGSEASLGKDVCGLLKAVRDALMDKFHYINENMSLYPQAAFQVLMNMPGIESYSSMTYVQSWLQYNEGLKRRWLEFPSKGNACQQCLQIRVKDVKAIRDYAVNPSRKYLVYYNDCSFGYRPTLPGLDFYSKSADATRPLSSYYQLKVYDMGKRVYFDLEFPDEFLKDIFPNVDIPCPQEYDEMYKKFREYVKEQYWKEKEEYEESQRHVLDGLLGDSDNRTAKGNTPLTEEEFGREMKERRLEKESNKYKTLGDGWAESFRSGIISDVIWLNDSILLAALLGNRVWGWDVNTRKLVINIQLGNIKRNGSVVPWDNPYMSAKLARIDDNTFVAGDGLDELHLFKFDGSSYKGEWSVPFESKIMNIDPIDATHLLVGCKGGSCYNFNIVDKEIEMTLVDEKVPSYTYAISMSVSQNKKYAAIAYLKYGILIWDLVDGKMVRKIDYTLELCTNVGMLWEDDRILVYSDEKEVNEGYIRRVDVLGDLNEECVSSCDSVFNLKEYDEDNYMCFLNGCVCIIPKNGKIQLGEHEVLAHEETDEYLISAQDNGLYLWSIESCELIANYSVNWNDLPSRINGGKAKLQIVKSPDDSRILLVINNYLLFMFETETLNLIWRKSRHETWACYFSSDSKYMLTDDKKAPDLQGVDEGYGQRILDAATGDIFYASRECHGMDAGDVLREYDKFHPAASRAVNKKTLTCRLSDKWGKFCSILRVKADDGDAYELFSHIPVKRVCVASEGLVVLTGSSVSPVKVVIHEC